MRFQPYIEQLPSWPQSGRHIMAQFDDNSIYVYQAYRPSTAKFAVEHQRFGQDFSFNRMSWIKPNFLWMMHRAGWASKEHQEHILAVRLRRCFFDELLCLAVPSVFDPVKFANREDWRAAVTSSDVRLQWDPDHDPCGKSIPRRAVQLGIRGGTLRRYGSQEIISIEDITKFVIQQREHLGGGFRQLIIPEERVYVPQDPKSIESVGIDDFQNPGQHLTANPRPAVCSIPHDRLRTTRSQGLAYGHEGI